MIRQGEPTTRGETLSQNVQMTQLFGGPLECDLSVTTDGKLRHLACRSFGVPYEGPGAAWGLGKASRPLGKKPYRKTSR